MDMIIDGTHLAYLREGSAPETVVYFWIQGEADRQAAPGVYLNALQAHWNRIRARLDDLYPAARKMILLMQTAGSDQSHHGSDTNHAAADQLAFVAGRDDAVMVGPIYPSALSDRVHPDLQHSRIMGELAAWALRETMAGRGWTIPHPTARRQGDRITLRFALPRTKPWRAIRPRLMAAGASTRFWASRSPAAARSPRWPLTAMICT